jgi:hypothetical protein
MSFKILYIEDEIAYSEKVEKALGDSKALNDTRSIVIKSISTPDKLLAELDEQYDLVLADVYFRDNSGMESNQLDDIIRIIAQWSDTNGLEKPLPIIAYTRREKGALDSCLERRNALYDIWDKSSASPPYAAWRMTRIASEIARSHPDSLLQRLIRQMPSGARWHSHVVEMTRRYSSAWTESDQIDRVKSSIGAIAMQLGESPQCKAFWEIMQAWDPLSRSVSETARGHARHVLNVFWLGYYLLHQPELTPLFLRAWEKVLDDREGMGVVKAVDPKEALSDCWFYAGLFHDVAGCIEKHGAVTGKADALFGKFKYFIKLGDPARIERTSIETLTNDLLGSLKPLRGTLETAWSGSLDQQKPDHGVLAGANLVKGIKDSKQNCFAREAARAMVVHNLISSLPDGAPFPISWESEPIICLLLLCDQIQTWDRERGTEKLSDQDGSERAELVGLDVNNESDRVQINLGIDYLGPSFLDHAPLIFERVKLRLENVLQDFPHKALNRIAKPWPFSVVVNCSLNGRPVNGLRFGPVDKE